MAKDKKPSIFADRGTIGSSDELDEYGVWVKSEPQDLSQALPEVDEISPEIPDTENLDAAIPDLEDLPDFDTLNVASQDNSDSLSIPKDDYDLPDFETDDKTAKTTEEDNESDVFNFGELADPGELNSIDLDSGNLDSGDLDLPKLDSAELNSVEPAPDDDGGFKEISMDEFVGTPNSPDPAESEDSLGLTDSLESEGSLELDDSLEIDNPLGSTDSLESDSPNEIEADIENVINEAPIVASVPEGILKKETQGLDLSTQLLMKIAEELSSIRNELSTLKKEFSGLKTAAPQTESKEKDFLDEDDEKISLTGDELDNILNTADFTEEAGSDAAIGLSDNENDSDELSISTADLDMEIDLSDSNLEKLEGETMLGNSSIDNSLDNGEDNQIDTDTKTDDDSILDFSSDETDELNEILENGVEPMSLPPEPEDANYLTDDPLAEDAGSGDLPSLPEVTIDESLDLSGAVIDEPDLSSEIQDNPLEEPSLEDISINLDMSDLSSPDFGSAGLDSSESDSIEFESPEENITLPEDASQDGEDLSIIPDIPEDFVVEDDNSSEVSGKEESIEEPAEAEEVEEILEEVPEEVIEEVEEVPEEESEAEKSSPAVSEPVVAKAPAPAAEISEIPANVKTELKTVLSYMDQLLEALPDDKIEEFAKSDYYDTYKKLFKELGLV